MKSILYRIRNGKGYATETEEYNREQKKEAKKTLGIVLDSIIQDISKNVKDKKIYIPDYIHYSLPATEKQFTGNFPSGTYVSIPKDMIVGIHWENVGGNSIDLDLSVISSEGKTGWDSDYRTEKRDILFSGDMTDASKRTGGASELFYIRRQKKEALILFVNYYNFEEKVDVPFKIFVAQEQVSNLSKNYMIDPNNLISAAASKINQKEKILGLIVATTEGNRFYFAEAYIGSSITSSNSIIAKHSRRYLFDFYENTINLKDILIKAGADIVDKKDKCEIDLSPEALEKNSILNLLKRK